MKIYKTLMALTLGFMLINPTIANAYQKTKPKPKESSGRLTVIARDIFVEPIQDILWQYYKKHPEVLLTLKTGKDEAISNLILEKQNYDVFIGINQEEAFDYLQSKLVRKSYLFAVEQLALYAPHEKIQDIEILQLQTGKITILEPKVFAAGRAAMQTLQTYGLDKILADRIIFAKSLDEQYKNITSKKAEAGFFPYSFLHKKKLIFTQETWLIPQAAYEFIPYSLMINVNADVAAEQLVLDLLKLASKQATTKYGFADISSLDPKARPKKIQVQDFYPAPNKDNNKNIISVPIHK